MRTVRCSSPLAGGCLPRGVSARGGCTPPPLWTEFLTQACENITFPRLHLRTVIKEISDSEGMIRRLIPTSCNSQSSKPSLRLAPLNQLYASPLLNPLKPLADLGGRARHAPPPFAWHPSFWDLFLSIPCTFYLKTGCAPPHLWQNSTPHLPGILVFDDILGHIV